MLPVMSAYGVPCGLLARRCGPSGVIPSRSRATPRIHSAGNSQSGSKRSLNSSVGSRFPARESSQRYQTASVLSQLCSGESTSNTVTVPSPSPPSLRAAHCVLWRTPARCCGSLGGNGPTDSSQVSSRGQTFQCSTASSPRPVPTSRATSRVSSSGAERSSSRTTPCTPRRKRSARAGPEATILWLLGSPRAKL
jgi:hypothetical protein